MYTTMYNQATSKSITRTARFVMATVLIALAISGCGQDQYPTSGASQQAPVQEQQQAQEKTTGWVAPAIGAAAGFALGRMTAPDSTPQRVVVVQQPAVVDNRSYSPSTPSQNNSALMNPSALSVPKPSPSAPAFASPSTPKPQVVIPKASITAVAPAKPSYSGPTGYSSVKQSAPTYSAPKPSYSPPKVSYSAPVRSAPIRR